jgi:hypothetical protein
MKQLSAFCPAIIAFFESKYKAFSQPKKVYFWPILWPNFQPIDFISRYAILYPELRAKVEGRRICFLAQSNAI